MEQELVADEKECAEHVELGQNDMGKVRRFQ
jgi:anthranilate/para-aminobenzoate synthase component I